MHIEQGSIQTLEQKLNNEVYLKNLGSTLGRTPLALSMLAEALSTDTVSEPEITVSTF